jgi:hypothetical protein
LAYSLKYRRYRSRRPGLHTVTEVRAGENYTLWLKFDDGVEGHVFLGDLVGTASFGRLSDEAKFRRAAIDPVSNAITWEGELTLDPDVLYRDVASQAQAALH